MLLASLLVPIVSRSSPNTPLIHNVEAISSAKYSMSPAIASAQPVRKPCPAASVAARPIVGLVVKLTRIRPSGPRAPESFRPAPPLSSLTARAPRFAAKI